MTENMQYLNEPVSHQSSSLFCSNVLLFLTTLQCVITVIIVIFIIYYLNHVLNVYCEDESQPHVCVFSRQTK